METFDLVFLGQKIGTYVDKDVNDETHDAQYFAFEPAEGYEDRLIPCDEFVIDVENGNFIANNADGQEIASCDIIDFFTYKARLTS